MMECSPDEVIESHYIETLEGLFFAVKGLVHPPERYLGCLRYAPDPAGERQKDGLRYRRLYHFAEQEDWLRAHAPHCLAFEPSCQAVLQSVRRGDVARIYDPRRRLQELRTGPLLYPVIRDSVAFAGLLRQAAGVPWSALGVSGSLLIGLHTPASDLDVTVYGREDGRAVQRALHRALDAGTYPELRRLDPSGQRMLYAERVADTHMAFEDFIGVERDKINQGEFGGRPYFLRFVLRPQDLGERYGDRCYEPAGHAVIRATVLDAREAVFTPCRYPVGDVTFLDGAPAPHLREIVSYRGRFCEQAQEGQLVRASGLLEKVESRSAGTWHRLLLGNAADDTMLPWR